MPTDEEKPERSDREEQLMTAPKADASDAAPRIDVTERPDGVTRINVRDDAKYRPGRA
ncbi:multidrug transporter [Subtercola vilae]|uniref:Multidrug transporter n=1 Tax=Subtercola vilae TaxID=2056433 RepID=A0A4T2BXH2_9MICO|nr:multidrug transporter [Subtercola vilae]MEA9986844.1 multidrug transporter [Subtercola sp. RTI3]TIH34338.1 multidrug transporter [Subtercola vilae]